MEKNQSRKLYKPQEGKQTEFLSNISDLVIYGGSAGVSTL